MQGMMIQDFSTSVETAVPQAKGSRPEPQKQAFGQVLNERHTTSKSTSESAAAPEKQVTEQEVHVASESESSNPKPQASATPEAAKDTATPFFMSALFGQNADMIAPSAKAELVSAAERVQELIGSWLQAQAVGEETQVPVMTEGEVQEVDMPDVEELMSLALDLLAQTTGEKKVEETGTQEEQILPSPENREAQETFVLDEAERNELRQLMAIMFQSGQVPQKFQDHPLNDEVRRQLELVVPSSEGQQVQKAEKAEATEAFSVLKGAHAELKEVTPEVAAAAEKSAKSETEEPAPVVEQPSRGLQEEQLSRMLKPRDTQPTLHQQTSDKQPATEVVAQNVSQDLTQATQHPGKGTESVSELLKDNLAKPAEQNPATLQHPVAGGEQKVQFAPLDTGAARIMQLPSGHQVAENQVVDQVVTYLAGSSDGESGRMRLRLHPAELGTVRLDLIVEGDKVRAHLQAQSQQVQDVLDRHLPQLRDALQQQGLKIDEFRVDVQTGQDQQQDERFAWQQNPQRAKAGPWRDDEWAQPELEIPLAQLLEQNAGGISLRV